MNRRLLDELARRKAALQSDADALEALIAPLVQRAATSAAEAAAQALTPLIEQLATQVAATLAQNLSAYLTPLVEQSAERIVKKSYYISTLGALSNSTASQRSPHELFNQISDDHWLWLNTEGARLSPEVRKVTASLPEDKNLEFLVGTMKGDVNLTHGFRIYQTFRGIYKKHKGPLTPSAAVLDFGCGWGRVLRFFLKEVKPSGLWGVDPWREFIQGAKQTDKWSQYDAIETLPPTKFPSGKFDLIYCYSVFSHLSEEVHKMWLPELARLLKPGGLLIASTMGRDHIQWAANLRKQPPPPDADAEAIHVHKSCATLFPDEEQALADYDSGKYCRSTYANYFVAGQLWGDTCIPKAYVISHWSKYFTILDYIDDRTVCDQDLIVATCGS
jgi:SAM-dependent methyltransferase